VHSNLSHQQLTLNGRRLFHYSLPAAFVHDVRLHLSPKQRLTTWAHQTFRLLTRILVVLGLAALFAFAVGMTSEMARMRNALETCSRMGGFDSQADPPVVTVTATVASWDAPQSTLPPTTRQGQPEMLDDVEDVSAPATITVIDVTSSSISSSQHEPKHAKFGLRMDDVNALLPLRYVYDQRIFHFELPTVEETFNNILDGIGVVWKVMKRIYHYPMDPP
jgi:hypothetical protein